VSERGPEPVDCHIQTLVAATDPTGVFVTLSQDNLAVSEALSTRNYYVEASDSSENQ